MDKNEYRAKLDEINDLVDRQDYKGALEIVDTIDWRRVRSARTLCMVGEIYEANKRYQDSRRLLLLAHQRAPIGKTVIYRLVELSIKMGNFDEAADYYKRFVEISPNDNSRYILKYKIYRAKRSSIEEQISILQEYKGREYTERWAYELARLYAKAGMKEACVEECDDLILWFSEGKYVTKAMELKMKFKPLTAAQQEKYNSRFARNATVTSAAAVSAVEAASGAALKTVSRAASQTAENAAVQSGFTQSQDKEIEEILNSITIGGDTVQIPTEEVKKELNSGESAVPEELPVYTPQLEQPENLQDRVAKGLRDVFQGTKSAGEEETAAAYEPSPDFAGEDKGYVVKDLEPEEMQQPGGFKPFHIGGAMTMEVKAEAPKSQMFRKEDFKEGTFKTDTKDLEFDLEALLAETANELAQAVAEETESEETKQTETAEQSAQKEALSLKKEQKPAQEKVTPLQKEQEPAQEEAPSLQEEQEPAQEEAPSLQKEQKPAQEEAPSLQEEQNSVQEELEPLQKEQESVQEESVSAEAHEKEEQKASIPAPAAAKAAMIAESLSAALAEKAMAFDSLSEKEALTEPEDKTEASVTKAEEVQKETAEAADTPKAEVTPEALITPEEQQKETAEAAKMPKAEVTPEALITPEEQQKETAEAADTPKAEVTPEALITPEEQQKETAEAADTPKAEVTPEALITPEEQQEKIQEPALEQDVLAVSAEQSEPTVRQQEILEQEAQEGSGTTEAQDATKEFPVEEVKEALGEINLAQVLEQELEDTLHPNKEESHMKRVTASVAADSPRKSMAFNTAVEGVMRHHLTEEEHRRLFTYFAPIPGMSEQINEALDIAQESACAKTSQAGNIIVTGREGSGKTRLSEGLIKALCKERKMEGAKVAYLTAKQLNKKDPAAVVGKLAGGFLVVENAGELEAEIVENMSRAMEFKTNRLTVILEDLKPGIRRLEEKYPAFMQKFDSRIVIPVFTNDELVSFAKTYAKELGYKIDDMAVLALYTLIGDNQNEENPVAIGMVREMMDEAIKRASRKGRRAGKKVGKRHLDESGRIMLYEKDFDV